MEQVEKIARQLETRLNRRFFLSEGDGFSLE